ncbi:sugar-binding transcriptional regulator [Propionispora hippei]|uniref:DNA-binding transcriptional regulator LsrR, DeoR family n=1 Tax=Propionispora hippei DSM 15287 TaxID=1123003 RepID=A0A1M6JM80_9FIRM|nr:sugar-binding transcriptional regulator [Propionispora hippei]SHJ47796.1 DNA-binding transcriptional regulator LsrR, DeoR family [Propionispora hippei DSM 15287]
MPKIIDGSRLVVKCCKLYYEENYTQNEIAKLLEISRPTVSRLLKEGKESGVVRIEIVNPLQDNFESLERRVEQLYGLKEVIIVEDEADVSLQTKNAAKAAASYLMRIVKPGNTIGVSMGTMVKAVAKYIDIQGNLNLTFVPLVGGVGQSQREIHPNEIITELAKSFGGNFKLLHAPAVVSNENIKKEILKEQSIKEVLDHTKLCNVGLVGIGSPTDPASTIMGSGYFNLNDTSNLQKAGAIGDVCLRFYDIHGHTEQFDFNKRVVGIELEDLKKIDIMIGVACGENKVMAIIGALNSKLINVLVTNYSNALKIAAFKEEN